VYSQKKNDSEQGLASLAFAMIQNKTLTDLSIKISWTDIPTQNVDLVLQAICCNLFPLKTLHITSGHSPSTTSLTKLIAETSTLTSLTLSHDNYSGLNQFFADALISNTTHVPEFFRT